MKQQTRRPYDSYAAGFNDVIRALDFKIVRFKLVDYPDEDKGELDQTQYDRGRLDALIEGLARERERKEAEGLERRLGLYEKDKKRD